MADNIKELDSVIEVDGEKYSVIAAKVEKSLTITTPDGVDTVFDGSEQKSINIPASLPASGGNADTVDNKHAEDFVQSVKIGTTEYKNGTTVTLPAYPTTLKNPNSLTIQGNSTTAAVYDGSNAKTINIKGSGATTVSTDTNGVITISSTGGGGTSDIANKINVKMDSDESRAATISIKSSDPEGGNIGDIWFKY